MGSSQQRHILFVVGMHRSGTSAVCAALEACGVSFGDDLLAPMTRVNERGFWEAERVVALNEELLELAGGSWYTLGIPSAEDNFSGGQYDDCRVRASDLLRSGFGGSAVEAVKDPRLCLTLPFWLQVCAENGLDCSVCTVERHPLAIARSLEIRDGLPPGYGLRLIAHYRRQALRAIPPGSPRVLFEALLESPGTVLAPLLDRLSLDADDATLRNAVDVNLRHHSGGPTTDEALADWSNIGSAEFDAQVEARYPLAETLVALADSFVRRGQELTRVGELHSAALAVIEQRDGQLLWFRDENNRIGALHSKALATIEERDEQIRDFDRRLEALEVQLNYLRSLPVLGRVLGALLARAQR